MPSSISSFERTVPGRDWTRLALAVLVIVALLCGAWEGLCRFRGYGPTLNDNPFLWGLRRDAMEGRDEPVVVIGSSRSLFDLRLDILSRFQPDRPLFQLAMVGSSPLPVLKHLADDPKFQGTVICGVTPVLFFAPGGPLVKKPEDWLKFYREESPSQKIGARLGIVLQRRLAFLQQEDLTLSMLLASLRLPNRPAARVPPRLPPYMYTIETDRQAGMIEKLETDPAFQQMIKDIWQPLFSVPPLDDATRDAVIASVREDVQRIRDRGGEVIFIRPPSTGWLRQTEDETTPRRDYWDRLLRETGAPGVHFEDYPELSGFDCPEWSHIRRADAALFTARLVPILKKIGR